MKIEKHSGYHQ